MNQIASRASDLGGAAPPNTTDDDPVALGRAAWGRIKEASRKSWGDWKLLGAALLVGKKHALNVANKFRPEGSKYNKAFGDWCQVHGLDEIDKSDRGKLLKIMENIDEIEKWRAKLPEGKRVQLNHPSSVWRAWTCPNRGNRGRPRTYQSNGKVNGEPFTFSGKTLRRVPGEEAEELSWQRALLLIADKAVGTAKFEPREPPEADLIVRVRQAADALAGLADKLQAIADEAAHKAQAKEAEEHASEAA